MHGLIAGKTGGIDALATLKGPAPASMTEAHKRSRLTAAMVLRTHLSDAELSVVGDVYDPHAILMALSRHYEGRSGPEQALAWQALSGCHQESGEKVAEYWARFVVLQSAVKASGLVVPEHLFAYIFFFSAADDVRTKIDISILAPPTDGDIPAGVDFAPGCLDLFDLCPAAHTVSSKLPTCSPGDKRTVTNVLTLLKRKEAELTAGEEAFAGRAADSRERRQAAGNGRSVQQEGRRQWQAKKCDLHPNSTNHATAECNSLKAAIEYQRKQGGAKALYSAGESSTVEPYSVRCALATAAMCMRTTESPDPSQKMCLDSGASRTMVPTRAAFVDYQPFSPKRKVILADNSVILAHGYGTVTIDARVDGCPKKLVLTHAWHVPSMGLTLISVAHLHTHGVGAYFPPNGLAYLADSNVTLAHASRSASGWFLGGRLRMPSETEAHARAALDELTAHMRLGHLNFRDLKKASQVIDGLAYETSKSVDKHCDGCQLGKSKRQPFQTSTNRASAPNDVLVADLCGAPGDVPAIGGYHYTLVMVDEYSSKDWCHLLRRKNDAAGIIMQHIVNAERQIERLVLTFRSDGGGEFKNAKLEKFLCDRGIRIETTHPHTSQENGIAERMIGLSSTMTATAMASVECAKRKLPRNFWGLALLAMSHTRRFWPCPRNEKMSREEAHSGKRPDGSYLRIFGAEAAVNIPAKERRDRYGPRAEQGVLVGYTHEQGVKGWKFAVERTNTNGRRAWHFVNSRDATFREAPLVQAVQASRYTPPEPVERPGQPSIVELDKETHQSPVLTLSPAPESDDKDVPDLFSYASDDEDDEPPQLPASLAAPDRPLGARDVAAVPDLPARRTRGGAAFRADSVDPQLTALFEASLSREDLLTLCAEDKRPYIADDDDEAVEWRKPSSATEEGLPTSTLTEHKPRGAGTGSGPHVGASQSPLTEEHLTLDPAAFAYAAMGGVFDPREPRNRKEAMAGPDAHLWRDAEDAEKRGHADNGTWTELAPNEVIPQGAEVLGAQWVYALNVDADGNITRHKARLVALGNRQSEGKSFDRERLWAPTARYESMRAFLSVCAKRGLQLHQLDVTQAYLNGELKEVIYLKLPHGKIVRLRKTLYGLRQAAHEWNAVVDAALRELGFQPTSADRCVYVGTFGGHFMIVLLYVDDMKIGAKAGVPELEQALRKRFKLKSLGDAPLFLGCRILQDLEAGTITVDQRHYIEAVLRRYRMDDANPNSLPMQTGLILTKADCAKTQAEKGTAELFGYAACVGALMWIALITRPDIAFAVFQLARFIANPGPRHVQAAKGVLRYLAGSLDSCLVYSRDADDGGVLSATCDASWGDRDDKKSTMGLVVFNAGGPISWSSRGTDATARSSLEAEYYALDGGVCELIWVKRLLEEIDGAIEAPPLRADNEGAIALARHETNHRRSKHIDIKFHFIRQCWARRLVTVARVPTKDNVADIFTKALPRPAFEQHRAALLGSK
jgi:transposase InsO family protein